MRKARWFLLNIIFLLSCLTAYSQLTQQLEIFRYIEQNKLDSIEYFLEQGNDINGIYPRYTLLEMAIIYNQVDVVNLLIDQKANVNLQNNRSTPLFLSVIYGQKYQSNKIVEILVNHNANVDFVGINELTPFVLACRINNSPAAEFLYEKGADPSIRDNSGNDFFYYVLHGNDPSLISYFVSKGFEIPRMSSIDDGPYVRMMENGRLEAYHMHYDSLTDRANWFHSGWREEAKGVPDSEAIKYLSKKNHLKYNDEYINDADIFVVSDPSQHQPPPH